MNSVMFCWARRALLVSIAVSGMIFATLLLSASVSVIGFKISAAVSYGMMVLLVWFMLEVMGRFGGEWFVKNEPWVMMGVVLIVAGITVASQGAK